MGLSEEQLLARLKANPSVGKDQPPDLACFVPSGSTVLPDPPQPATSSKGHVEIQVSVDNKSTASTGTWNQVVQITEETIAKHEGQLGTKVSDSIKSRLREDFERTLMILKSTAYTEGFSAGKRHYPHRTY